MLQFVLKFICLSQICGYGGIGRRAGFRFRWATVQVRPLLPVPKKHNGFDINHCAFLLLQKNEKGVNG